jgi:hypothetical protein
MVQKMNTFQINLISRRLAGITFLILLFNLMIPTKASADVDLQSDLNRITSGINKFDANSANSTSVSSISGIKKVFSNNAKILAELQSSIAIFKTNLNSVKAFIPNKDTKESPRFSTLMNLAVGYEVWLRYQKLNQSFAEKCLKSSGESYQSFTNCSIKGLQRTLENERLGRNSLQSAWNAWRQWQVKFGYAK